MAMVPQVFAVSDVSEVSGAPLRVQCFAPFRH